MSATDFKAMMMKARSKPDQGPSGDKKIDVSKKRDAKLKEKLHEKKIMEMKRRELIEKLNQK